ncbi:glycoside hydrolase superfamily [Scenedesmus sp. NREL 46B-D3]|nr:glycoside hydrolase superfamily [Scenedesmus sp. NREL 46B-D3]
MAVLRAVLIGVLALGGSSLHAAATAVLPALQVDGNVLKTTATRKQVDLKGASWFGFNVDTGMVDGLWAGIDLATTSAQLKLLGFNTLRIPFDFSLLKAPASDFRWAGCMRKDIVNNTLDPRLAKAKVGRTLRPRPPGTLPPVPPLSPPGMCNSYVPRTGAVEELLLWTVEFFVAQGFYVMLNHHSLVSGDQIQRNPSDFANAWARLWGKLAAKKQFQARLLGRVFVDITNEPDFMGMKWSDRPDMIGATEMYLRVMDRLHAITPRGMLYFVEGTGQTSYGLCWGNGFVTDTAIVAKHGIDDASPFFRRLVRRPYVGQVVISPHEYGPTIRKTHLTTRELEERMNASYGYLMTRGFCHAGACTKFPVVVGEFGSDMGAEDMGFLTDFGRWMRRQASNSWVIWAVNANSGDTGGLFDKTLWQDVRWDKVRYLVEGGLGLRPWWKEGS